MKTNVEKCVPMELGNRFASLGNPLTSLGIALLMVFLAGCSTVHFSVSSAPVRPEDTGRFAVPNPEVPTRVQIANFDICQVDTQYPEREKELYRRHFAIAIPNLLQEFLGKRQAFSEVTRVTTPKPDATDYVITGTYDFFERIGTQGREWIPFAGTFGAPINEATVKGTLSLRIVEATTGAIVPEKIYPEEHSERTSVYKKANVGYLQADYMGKISTEVIKAISDYRQHDVVIEKNEKVDADIKTEEKNPDSPDIYTELTKLDDLRKKGIITDEEFEAEKAKILNRSN